MYGILHALPRPMLVLQGATFVPAFLIAEFFYKFHSFSLECLAFLATWYVFGAVTDFVVRRFRR